jgi:hypothetical protein
MPCSPPLPYAVSSDLPRVEYQYLLLARTLAHHLHHIPSIILATVRRRVIHPIMSIRHGGLLSHFERAMVIEGQRYNERSVIGRVSAISCVSGPDDPDQQRGKYKSGKSSTATKEAGCRSIVYHPVFVAGSRVGCFTRRKATKRVTSRFESISTTQLPTAPISVFFILVESDVGRTDVWDE